MQYSTKIDESYNDIFAEVMDYEAYCEMCKEFDISKKYTKQDNT